MRSPPLASLAALALLAACSDVTGSARGGDHGVDTGGRAAGPSDPAPTFTALYDAFFGPRGKAACAGDGACHGAADKPGAQATASAAYPNGYVCAPDKESCWRAMTGAGLTSLGGGGAEQTTLYTILRKSSGGGSMPKRPFTVTFSETEMASIRAWIAAGAKND